MDLRRRIASLHGLPVVPPAMAAALQAAGAWPPVRVVEGVRQAPALSLRLRQALAITPAAGLPRGEREVLERLGRLAASKVILSRAALAMFPLAGGKSMDRAQFWRHSLASAEFAAGIAGMVEGVEPVQAYAAGLFHDIGKIVLDILDPEAYQRSLDAARTQGAFVLDAEQQELGADHTLAGKWAAEAWEMPDWLQSAIWLHHHPPAALAAGHYPVRLVDVVALADWLARRSEQEISGAFRLPPAAEERRRRLGIDANQLTALSPGTPFWETEEGREIEGPFAAEDLGAEVQRLQEELHRVQGMQSLALALASCHTEERALTQFARVLREHFPAPSGICVLMDRDRGVFEGKCWRTLGGDVEHLAVPESGTNHAEALRFLRRLTRRSQAISGGLLVLPLTAGEEVLGQIMLDFGTESGALGNAMLPGLLQFCEAGAALLLRCRRFEASIRRQEALTTSLWRQELQAHQRLRMERLGSVARLAAGAAHEINNPLAIISGQAQILMGRASTAEEKRALDLIVQQARRAGKVLIDLMQFARPAPPKLEPVLLPFLLHQLATQLRDPLEKQGIRIVEDYTPGLPRIPLDRRQMEQVFRHLIQNAEHAMRAHGGTLTLRARATRDRRSLILQVGDTGPGILPEDMNQVFEPFFSHWEGEEGAGLGLSVCHGILESHRGSITLHSTAQEGTTCTLTLPATLEKTERPEATQPAPPAPQDLRPKSVLVIDRQEDLREVLRETLQARGMDVRTAADSLEAMAALMGHTIDAVLLDLDVYTPRGVPILQLVRERFPHLPVIALAAADMADSMAEAEKLGAQACLLKPFRLEHLLAELELLLEQRNVA